MISILRKVSPHSPATICVPADYQTELRYAKRCMWGVVGWGLAIAAIILVCVLVRHFA